MKIKRLEIEGFGKFINKDFDLSNLTIFLGNNEAGKSTILSFIKYILFGFENKTKSNRDFYPKNHKIYGGRIYLEIGEYDLILERIQLGKNSSPSFSVRLSDGQEISQADWQDLLSPVSSKLFDQIYSISQDNLQISRERDYDASSIDEQWKMAASTGSLTLYQMTESIQKERDSLYTSSRAMTKPLKV